ncbi:unnamed protein product [Musa textilis]
MLVLAKGEEKSDIGASGRLTAGGLAGAVAQTAIYPLDLVKTRLQTYACEGGIDLSAYETLKDMSRTYILKDSELGPLVQLGCGTNSGALGATCVYPLLVIRTRMQAQRTNSSSAYNGMSDVFWKTLRNEGFWGFYKGIFPNLLKVVPYASITYLVYETMKKSLISSANYLVLLHDLRNNQISTLLKRLFLSGPLSLLKRLFLRS